MALLAQEIRAGRVVLVDPNDQIAVDARTPNGTPPEEWLRPYVALSVYRRRGGVIRVDENGRFAPEFGEETLRVNLLDFDPEKGYSESYLDDNVGGGDRKTVGGFGIRSFSIKLNANYVPEVSITFIDLHGGSLFRAGAEGPLAVLYDYPPPMYKLTVKGAYGKYVEYDLHPLQETNRFGGGITDSPEITVKFIGQYFGPMTDVLLGYIKAVPFLKGIGIVGAGTLAPNKNTPPASYYDLVQRGKLLYTVLDNFKSESGTLALNTHLDQANKKLQALETRLAGLLNPDSLTGLLQANLRIVGATELGGVVKVLPPGDPQQPHTFSLQLPAGALAAFDGKLGVDGQPRKPGDGEKTLAAAFQAVVLDPLQAEFGQFAEDTPLARKFDFQAPPAQNKLYRLVRFPSETGPFVVLYDFAALRKQLAEYKTQVAQQGAAANAAVQGAVAERSNQVLGTRPTVGAITKLVCDDFDYFMERIRAAGVAPPPDPNKRESEGARAVGKLSWPTVYEQRAFATDRSQSQEVKRYPGLYPGFAGWPEVQFVEEYCRACIRAAEEAQRTDQVRVNLDLSSYVPISALERIGRATNSFIVNPYLGADSVFALVRTMTTRYLFCQDYAYAHVFHVANSCTPRRVAGKVYDALTGGLVKAASKKVTGYDGSPVDEQDGSTYGLIDAVLGELSLPGQNKRRELIQRVARLEARNAARGMAGNKTLSAAVRQLSRATPAELAQRLRTTRDTPPGEARPGLSSDTPAGDENVAAVFLTRKINTTSPSLELSGGGVKTAVHYRGGQDDARFQGIAAIVTGQSDQGKNLRTPKGTTPRTPPAGSPPPVDPLEHEDAEFLQGLSEAFLGRGVAAVVSEANLLVFPDKRAQESASGTAAGSDLHSDFFKPKNRNDGISSGDGFVRTVMTLLRGQSEGNGGRSQRHVLYRLMHALREMALGNYDGSNFNADLFGRFFYPGAIEMPTWYVLQLAFRARGKSYDPETNQFTPWDPKEAPVSRLDADQLFQFEDKFMADNGMLKVLDNWNKAVKAKETANDRDAAVLTTLLADEEWQRFTGPAYLINTSTLTFLKLKDNLQLKEGEEGYAPGFRSLYNFQEKLRTPYAIYAQAFWQELQLQLKETEKTEVQALSAASSPFNDPDYKTNIYYSFKAIYDRWLAGMAQPRTPLYDNFKFITRSYQNIADECVVDFQNLLDDASAADVGVYTALSRLLQQNGFLFFPLHSFVDFGTAGPDPRKPMWGGNFGLVEQLNDQTVARAAFVCMLAGSYSSQLNNVDNTDHPDDGFEFGNDQPQDFNASSLANPPVVAFRVRAGLQNQSIFGEPTIDSAEFKNTDVSFKLADDVINQQSTGTYRVRKSQNLLNVYEQRSYVCSVPVPLGNMCLQPTQYFQLEGLNLYGGAYLIHEVTHEFSADSQTLSTNFKGTRLGRYVFGVVSDPLLDYVGGGTAPAFGTPSNAAQSFNQPAHAGDATTGELRQLCAEFGYPVAMVKALIEVESGGNPPFHKTTKKCIARFEPRHFLQKTGKIVGARPKLGPDGHPILNRHGQPQLVETCHTGQTAEYAAIAEAEAIDKEKAWLSTSWGQVQVLGSSYAAAGFAKGTVIDMVNMFQASEMGQVRGALNYIKNTPRAHRGMLAKPVPGFADVAYGYNGAYYAMFNYDKRLQSAWARFSSVEDATATAGATNTLVVRREQRLDDRTIGVMQHQGEHVCWTLEDTVRPTGQFVRGVTAIEPGLYKIAVTHSPRLGRETAVLSGVPHHQDGSIRVHWGGKPEDSLGCVLTGLDKGQFDGQLHRQREAEDLVTDLVRRLQRQGDVFISIS